MEQHTIKKRMSPVVDYRKLRFSNLNSPEFRHVKLLLFWPIYGLLFMFVERFYPVEHYYAVHCSLDDVIPFCEYFVIPYIFWFIYMGGMVLYTFLYDIDAFKKMMKFIILTYSVTIFIYLIFPTCQELRPTQFERDNIFTQIVASYYQFDTNTNVCPSIHVIGSLAVMFAGLHAKNLQRPGWKIAFVVSAVLICLSTVFLKQHSAIDVVAALPLCAAAYYLCFAKQSLNPQTNNVPQTY